MADRSALPPVSRLEDDTDWVKRLVAYAEQFIPEESLPVFHRLLRAAERDERKTIATWLYAQASDFYAPNNMHGELVASLADAIQRGMHRQPISGGTATP